MGICTSKSSENQSQKDHSSLVPFTLIGFCVIWNKESHSLFDHESKNLKRFPLKLTYPGSLIKNQKEIKYIKEDSVNEPNSQKLFEIISIKEDYQLVYSDNASPMQNCEGLANNSIWNVVKSEKEYTHMGHKLIQGDVIKLGRMRLKIKTLKGCSDILKSNKIEDQNKTQENNLDEINNAAMVSNSQLNSLACRICLEKTETPDNLLITPCKCAGTMKFIHLKCLQKWLKSKNIVKQSLVSTTILFKTLSCELCKTVFPEFLEAPNGQKYPSFEIDMPKDNFIVLEILNQNKNTPKGIHIVDMKTKQNIRIGRGNDSDLKFSDISVSRTHALIHFQEGEFYLKDNNSKFGTLVLVRNPLSLNSVLHSPIQIGSTLVTFQNLIYGKGFKNKNKANTDINDIVDNRKTLENENHHQEEIYHEELEIIDSNDNGLNANDQQQINQQNNLNEIVFHLENEQEPEESLHDEGLGNFSEGDHHFPE